MYFTNKMNCRSNSDRTATESSALVPKMGSMYEYACMHVPLYICTFVRLYICMSVCLYAHACIENMNRHEFFIHFQGKQHFDVIVVTSRHRITFST